MTDWIEVVCRKKLGSLPVEWRVSRWEAVGDALIVHGGVSRLKKLGKNKGRRTWDNPKSHLCIVTDAEILAVKLEYEANTGLCAWCDAGQAWAGWKAATGHYFRDCGKCGATGKAKKELSK